MFGRIAYQWQEEQFLDVQVEQLEVVEETAPSLPFVRAENPDIFFVSFFELQARHVTSVVDDITSTSNSCPHSSQAYSYMGIGVLLFRVWCYFVVQLPSLFWITQPGLAFVRQLSAKSVSIWGTASDPKLLATAIS